MNVMKLLAAGALCACVSGCFTTSPEERRAALQKEFERLKSLPPAVMVASPNKDVAKCAKLSCDLFNEVQPLMKAYADKVETSREYIGFMNDIQYYVEDEKLSNQEACKKVKDSVVAADANRPNDQKVWPKIERGVAAANELDPKKQLAKIAILVARNEDIKKTVSDLPKSYSNEDFQGKLKRGDECSAISKQLAESAECLAYLGDQYARVVELENYAR